MLLRLLRRELEALCSLLNSELCARFCPCFKPGPQGIFNTQAFTLQVKADERAHSYSLFSSWCISCPVMHLCCGTAPAFCLLVLLATPWQSSAQLIGLCCGFQEWFIHVDWQPLCSLGTVWVHWRIWFHEYLRLEPVQTIGAEIFNHACSVFLVGFRCSEQ